MRRNECNDTELGMGVGVQAVIDLVLDAGGIPLQQFPTPCFEHRIGRWLRLLGPSWTLHHFI